jgi:hypothetical protein
MPLVVRMGFLHSHGSVERQDVGSDGDESFISYMIMTTTAIMTIAHP